MQSIILINLKKLYILSNIRNKKGRFASMDTIALILSIIGCVNWGLVGIFQFDLVAWLFGGSGSLFSRLVYTIIALAGLWCISFLFRRRAIVDGE